MLLEQQILNQKDTGYATSVSGSVLDILLVSREVFRESTPWCLIKNLVKKFKRHPKHSILGCKSVSHEGRTPAKHQTFAKRHPFREQFRDKRSHTADKHGTNVFSVHPKSAPSLWHPARRCKLYQVVHRASVAPVPNHPRTRDGIKNYTFST